MSQQQSPLFPSGVTNLPYVPTNAVLSSNTFNSAAGVKLRFTGMVLLRSGNYQKFQVVSSVNISTTRNTQYQENFGIPTDGWIVSLGIDIAAGTPKRGQCYLHLGVASGATLGVSTTAVYEFFPIFSGYISGGAIFPLGITEPFFSGNGFFNSVQVTQPSTGADWTITVPTGARWRLHGLSFTLVSSGVAGNRSVDIFWNDGTRNVTRIGAPTSSQAASLTTVYGGSLDMSPQFGAALTTDVAYSIGDSWGQSGWILKTATVNLDAGDAFSNNIWLVVEELIDV